MTCAKVISRDRDVFVQVSKPTPASLLGVGIMLVGTTYSSKLHGDRIESFTSLSGVTDAGYNSTTEPYKAAREFFAQSPRPQKMYIGRIFTADQGAYGFSRVVTAVFGDFTSITDGEFSVTIDGDQQNITAIDFTGDLDMDDVAATVQTKLQAVGTGGYTAATFTWDGTNKQFKLTSGTTGATSTIAATGLSPVSGGSGTDISSDTYLSFYDDPGDDTDNLVIVDGYAVTGVADELQILYDTAAGCLNARWYGLVLTKEFRDAGDPSLPANFDIRDAAAWALTTNVIFGITTNDPNTKLTSSTDDVASDLNETSNKNTVVFYHDNEAYYPDSSAIARLLAVDYDAAESVITLKFKDLLGVPYVALSDTELDVLIAKRCNTKTRSAGSQDFVREGMTSNNDWYADESTNLAAMQDEMQTSVFSLYKTTGRVGFSEKGQAQHYDAIQRVCEKFVRNGTIVARPDSLTGEIVPAYTIDVPIPDAIDRAARTWTGITVDVNLTGATHSSRLALNAYV